MKNNKENKDSKIAGFVGSVIIHLLLFLLLIFTGIVTVIPDEEEGLTVNYERQIWAAVYLSPHPKKTSKQKA